LRRFWLKTSCFEKKHGRMFVFDGSKFEVGGRHFDVHGRHFDVRGRHFDAHGRHFLIWIKLYSKKMTTRFSPDRSGYPFFAEMNLNFDWSLRQKKDMSG